MEILKQVKIVHSSFIKKLSKSQFYELRIKAGNEYRVIVFAIDHLNFHECSNAVCLRGFQKKSTKDYKQALRKAEQELKAYLNNKNDG